MTLEAWIALASLIATIAVAGTAGVWALIQAKNAASAVNETMRVQVSNLAVSINHLSETVKDLKASHLAAVDKLDKHGERLSAIEGKLSSLERLARESA